MSSAVLMVTGMRILYWGLKRHFSKVKKNGHPDGMPDITDFVRQMA